MNAVPKYDPLAFGEQALKLRTYRQQVLVNNLANSDTPGFKLGILTLPMFSRVRWQNYAFRWIKVIKY